MFFLIRYTGVYTTCLHRDPLTHLVNVSRSSLLIIRKKIYIYRILVRYPFFMLTDWQYILLHVCPNNNSFRATSG